MSQIIQPHELTPEHTLVDVRSPREFESERIEGALNYPLGDLERACESLVDKDGIVLVCASGTRAEAAKKVLQTRSIPCQVLSGGLKEWSRTGRPVQRSSGSGGISVERQVRILAGLMASAGGLLALFVHPWFASIPAFVGAGLVFAGVTDTCAMALLLAKLPYNNRCSKSA